MESSHKWYIFFSVKTFFPLYFFSKKIFFFVFFLQKYLFFLRVCATCSELPSHISTMVYLFSFDSGCQKPRTKTGLKAKYFSRIFAAKKVWQEKPFAAHQSQEPGFKTRDVDPDQYYLDSDPSTKKDQNVIPTPKSEKSLSLEFIFTIYKCQIRTFWQ